MNFTKVKQAVQILEAEKHENENNKKLNAVLQGLNIPSFSIKSNDLNNSEAQQSQSRAY